MYDHTLHCARNPFYCYRLQAVSTSEILKSHVNDSFNITDK